MRYLITFLVISLWLPSTLQAEIVTIWGEGKHIMGDNDTKDDARKLALLSAKRMCLEKAGTYLESETIIKDLQLAKDEIKAYTAGIVKVDVVDEQVSLIGESPCVTVKVKADIDTSQLEERIEQLRKDEKILDDYKKMQADVERLTKQVDELQKQLEQAKGKEQIDKIRIARKDVFDGLTAVDWYNKALDELYSSHPNWDLVIKWSEKAIEIDTNYADAYTALGIGYAKKGLVDKAIASYKKAIELDPTHAKAYCNLGFAYGNKGLYDKEIASYKKAIVLDPHDATAHYNLGIAYGEKGLFDKAIASFKKAIEIKPDYAEAHYDLGLAYGKKGLFDKEIAGYKKAIEIKPDLTEAHYNLGIAYGEKGLYDKAIMSFKDVLELKPDDAKAHHNLGRTYGEKGLFDQAIVSCKRAIELKPDYPEAHCLLGIAYADIKYVAADYLYKAGLLFLGQGSREDALRVYGYMRQFTPNSELTSKLHRKLYPE